MSELGKTIFWKNQIKNDETEKDQSEIAACEQKPLARMRIFVQTRFAHSI